MTGRLELRPWADSDVPALLASFTDPELLRWTALHPTDETAAKEWLVAQRRGWDAGTRFSLVVDEIGDDGSAAFVGNVALKTARLRDGVSEVGYWTAPWARGRGVASAALIALTRWSFATFPLHRLELRHHLANEASCRVAVKAGFVAFEERHEGEAVGHLHSLTHGG